MKKKPRIEGAIHERNHIYNFHFHLIWVTKYRQELFTTPGLVEEMRSILQQTADAGGVVIESMEVMPDHIHLLVSFPPKFAPATIVKLFKGNTAKVFFRRHPEIRDAKMWGGHMWSHSYYMSTLGNMSRDVVERYIHNQYSK